LLALLVAAPVQAPLLMTVTDNESYSTRRLHAALCAATDRRPWLPSPPELVWRSFCKLWDMLRKEQAGGAWARMTADECYLSSGLDGLGFQPSLNFEASLGVVVDAA
ncbi:UDP-glucose 4-epimerase, partial [Congregibacter sp.]|nr:UDP-glucose 4-epimerase [Congregibacter sp.]